MATTLESESTLTDRYQTTVPETVRRALKLGKRDKIHYSIRPDGAVVMSRVTQTEEEDPVIRQFLGFLTQDLAKQPERIKTINPEWIDRIQSLVSGVEVDFDTPLSEDDE